MPIDQFLPPEVIQDQTRMNPNEAKETFVDPQSFLSKEEIEELAKINRRQYGSIDGLTD